jgi:hypothetical protein
VRGSWLARKDSNLQSPDPESSGPHRRAFPRGPGTETAAVRGWMRAPRRRLRPHRGVSMIRAGLAGVTLGAVRAEAVRPWRQLSIGANCLGDRCQRPSQSPSWPQRTFIMRTVHIT